MDKNKKKRIVGIGVIAAIAVAVAASGSCAIEQNAEGDGGVTVAASAVTSSINYQGRLTDSTGEPLSGAHEMTFKLYEVDSGGTALDTDTHSVTVTDGLFNTDISFKQSYFDGRELWLGIKVGADAEMMPRQEFKPVPYALSLVPGARIIGSCSCYTALHAESTHTSGRGIRGYATADSGTNFGVVGASKSPDAYGGYFYNNGGGTGVYGAGKYGGYFTTNQGGTSGNNNAGVNAITTHDDSDGVRASTSGYNSYGVYAKTTGDDSKGVFARTTGNHSHGVRASTSGYDSDGVSASTSGTGSHAVYARTTGDDTDGVRAFTSGNNSDAVYARTTGDDSDGVRAFTSGNNSDAVHAYSAKGYGVYGTGKYGGYFTTNQGGTWDACTAGVKVSTAHKYSDGVRAYTEGDRSDGVYARTYGYSSYGVYARTYGDRSSGVYARTDGEGSSGVYARTYGDNSDGVYARTDGDNSDGVYALTYGDNSNGVLASSKKGFGVYAVSHSLDCAGVYAKGKGDGADIILGGSDGKIQSDPTDTLSDINLIANRDIRIDLENDGGGGDADFSIYDKDDDCIFNVDESGDVTYGGPNIAAFPRPAYDSGWVSISQDTTKVFTHNLGGNPDNYVVDMQFKSGSHGRNQVNYGGNTRSLTYSYGVDWRELDRTQIKVHRRKSDYSAEQVRVRIWVYK